MAEEALSTATPLDVPRAEIGASPVWDVVSQSLIWVDVTGRRVHRYWPGTERNESHSVPSAIGSLALTRDGDFVLALEDGFWKAGEQLQGLRRVGEVDPGSGVRMNAGKVDSEGRFWVGSMGWDLRPGAGNLYRLDPSELVTIALSGIGEPNGLDWSPDGRTFYFVDSATRTIKAFSFDVATGAIRDPATLVRIDASEGILDGMTVDSEGFLWIAVWDSWSVRRYAPDGKLDRVIPLPVAQATGCAFGGGELTDLYVTTGAYQLSDDVNTNQPLAGTVFVVPSGVKGLPARRFGTSMT